MFTGIVQDVGRIQERELREGDMRLTIAVDRLDLARTAVGDSICAGRMPDSDCAVRS